MPIDLMTGEVKTEPLFKKTAEREKVKLTPTGYKEEEKVRITPADIVELYNRAVKISEAVQDLVSRIRAKRVLEEAGIEIVKPEVRKPPTETEKTLMEAGIEVVR